MLLFRTFFHYIEKAKHAFSERLHTDSKSLVASYPLLLYFAVDKQPFTKGNVEKKLVFVLRNRIRMFVE